MKILSSIYTSALKHQARSIIEFHVFDYGISRLILKNLFSYLTYIKYDFFGRIILSLTSVMWKCELYVLHRIKK